MIAVLSHHRQHWDCSLWYLETLKIPYEALNDIMGDLEEDLKAGIVRALGWDAFVAEGVVKAIADAGN
jgi:hypothetical protein